MRWLRRLAQEPPLRVLVRAVLGRLPASVETRALWELSPRPAYLLGVLEGARQARRAGVDEISAIEFGVAGGAGLLALEAEAAAVERETGIGIRVYGFDNGKEGLPDFIGDHRDHPDVWRPGDFPMDEPALRARLSPRTTLVLGNLRDMVAPFVERAEAPPVGFVAVDVDLYSSTREALRVLSHPAARTLPHVPVYFDDVDFVYNHRFAGELLAIDEFNREHEHVKIDRWRGVRIDRPFPERPFLDKLYVAHRLDTITHVRLERDRVELPLS